MIQEVIWDVQRKAYSYQEFVDLTERLLAEGKTTGDNHSEDYVGYTRINQQRTHRIYKTTEIWPELREALASLQGRYSWIILVEAWCGDVSQNLPVIAKAVEGNPGIDLKLILRDENLDIMDRYLTDGGRSVPKLIVRDAVTGEVVASWGPRPEPAQAMIRAYKAMAEKPPYMEFVKTVQAWYNHDHTQTLQSELLTLVKGLS